MPSASAALARVLGSPEEEWDQTQAGLLAQGRDLRWNEAPVEVPPDNAPMPALASIPGEEPIMRQDLYGNLPPELPMEEPPLPTEEGTVEENLPPVQTRPSASAALAEVLNQAPQAPVPAEQRPEDTAQPPSASAALDRIMAGVDGTGASQLAYDTTVRPENVEGPIPFGEKDRPYRQRSDGTLEFDPRRMGDGVTQALKDQVITGEQYAKLQPSVEAARKVILNEEKLRARAKDNGALASAIQGAGRGGAMTLGGVAGAKAGAAAGLLTGPYAPVASPVLGLAGGVAGAVTMGMNYDLVYKELAKHYEEYDAVLAAAELNPGYNTAGELVSVAVAAPQALRSASRALAATMANQGAAGVARQVAVAGGAGSASGVAGYSLDQTVRGEPITPGGMATAAAAGAAFAPFMITPGMARTPEMASITAKVKAGQPISPMERRIYESAAPAMRAAFAEMDAAGGQYTGGRYDAAGKWMPGVEVSVPTSSVLGLAPAAGRATVRMPYSVPPRLGAPAVARAQAFATRGAGGERTAGPAVPTGGTAPVVPRQAPINVLPPGPTIATPTQAMLGVEEYLARQVQKRGIVTKDNYEAILGLMDEHKQIVTDAIGRNEPVSIDALDSYEIRVPFYDRDETTGLATYSEESYKAYENYLKGQDAEGAENVRTGGIDIFEAIRDSGGLPSGKSEKVKQWSGELKRIREAQNPGNALGVKGTLNLFRKDAPDLDGLIKNLQGYGFKVTTPAELFDLIDQRFNTGKPIYAYGDEEMPMEMRGARRPAAPAPGAPRQGELLGESDVEFSLVGQADRTSMTPAEQAAATAAEAARAEAEAGQQDLFGAPSGARSTDPLTPPAQTRTAGPAVPTGEMRAGGPVRVPPGTPGGAGPASAPDWVLGGAETRDGRRLVKGIENYKPGQRWGFRSIVDYVNKAVRMEMRRSKSQTSAVHPAHYKPAHHMAYTRETQSQVNFHEAGHGLEYLIRARAPAFFDTFADELIALTNRPGSMASDPPASASDSVKRQYQIGEGVAEWTRLLMTEPAAVAGMRVTPALNAVADQYYPGMAAALRDGARAVQRFQNRPVAERWAMFNADPSVTPTANEMLGAIVRGGQGVAAFLASGAPVSRLDRTIFRAIMTNREQTESTYRQALAKARSVRAQTTDPLMSAHNMILSIGAEATNAIAGTKPGKGLRVIGPTGKFQQFTRDSWRDLRRKVPSRLLPIFDGAAWARESLTRYEAAKMEYPGMREGISPDDLRTIVANATRTLRNAGVDFDVQFAAQSAFFDEILNIKDFGGLKKPGEVDRMTQRDTYWPLPRVMQEGRGRAGKARGDMMAGDYRAFGSGEAIRQVDEVAEERVRAAYEAYYWNRFLNVLADKMAVVAKDKSLPIEARSIAGASIVQLKMPMKVAATVSKEEVIPWVLEAMKDQMEAVLGFRPELTAEDINLSWNFRDVWRPTKPGDAYVVSSLRGGERVFYQLGDPAMFGMFANPATASKFGRFVNWALGPMTQNWKRNITQGPVFALRNLFRDMFSQAILNPDPIAWIPGGTHVLGTINKFTQKYPQVFQEGLLLSRVEPGQAELVNKVQHGAVWQWLTEGFYVSQAKDPTTRMLATVLQPSNWLFPLWKVGDLLNLVTGGRTLAQFFETAGREGAAVSVLQRGGTDEEALMKYWTAAGQFNEHAGVADARIMMNVPGFFNPMVQGLRNSMQKLTDPDPGVRGTAWTRMLVMMPMMFGGAAAARYLFMDEEEKERERNRSVDDRMNFMELGGFSVPFPYGAEGVMASMVYNSVLDDMLDRPRVEAKRTAIMMMKRVLDPGSPLSVFGPQVSTLSEAAFNWSVYRQRHLVSPWMVAVPAGQQYYSTTPKFYQQLGEWFNYSPAKLQYIMQQAISRQADETIRYMESLDRGRPIQEPADVPFVGRLFVREPLGFSSQPLRDAEVVETRLRDLDMRLKAKGWQGLRDENYPQDQLGTTEMRNLHMQLQYLEGLRFGLRRADDISALAKGYALAENYAEERNTRRMLTTFTQSLLLGNKDMIERIDVATELLKKIPERPPQEKAAEYLERRF